MDNDIFGASVWGDETTDIVSLPKPTSSILHSSIEPHADLEESAFDDFDDFGPSAESTQVGAEDDDFGDFGDFGDTDVAPSSAFGDVGFGEEVRIAGPSTHKNWHSLKLDPLPSHSDLEDEVNKIMEPIWRDDEIAQCLTREGIREVEGITQILTTAESRDLYNTLLLSPPPTKPPNWTRSRIRRQHLITLGIPVNLDEVLPQANGKALPPLQISTRPMSAPPGPRNTGYGANGGVSTANNSRSGTPQPGGQPVPSHFGPKPVLDEAKIATLLAFDNQTLTIQPLPVLERHLTDLRAQTANTSALLTYLLQTRESLQQDSETYNRLIAELVGEAQKIKTGKPGQRTTVRRGSGMV